MNTARRVAAIVTCLRRFPHALRQGICAIAAALRPRWQALMLGVRARWVVFASLQDAAVRVAALQQQVAAARERLEAHEERERLLARSIHDGEAAAAELTQAATASAEETLLRARATTEAMVGSTQEATAATLRGAQEAAAATLRGAQEAAVATLQEARDAADATLQAARLWVDATLQTARATAQRDVEAMEQEASARIEPFMEAADRLSAAIREMTGEMEGRIQTAGAELSAKIARFETERDEYSGGLVALVDRHAETLERVAHLQADVHERLVPALNRLTAGLKGSDTSWLRPSPGRKDRGSDKGGAPPQAQSRDVTAAAGEAQRPTRSPGEVVVQHINSFHQVKKVVRALSQVGGIEAVRLLTYMDGVATIGVSSECSLASLDVKHLDGLTVDIVEAAPTRLVVRLGPSQPTLLG